MYWNYIQWLTTFIFTFESAFSQHAQKLRGRGGLVKDFSAVLKLQESPRWSDRHENMQRRKSKQTLEKLQELLAELENEQQLDGDSLESHSLVYTDPLADNEDFSDNDVFDENGMIYLTEPKLSKQRMLNNALNKAVFADEMSKKDELQFTEAEMEKLRELLSIGSNNALMRGGNEGAPQTEFRFEELVA